MLSYEMFKEYTKKELIARMPPEFARHRLEENEVYKVNRKLDAFRVMPPDTETGIMVIPVFYYQDFYPLIQKGETPERVLELIARAASESMVPPNSRFRRNNPFRQSEKKIWYCRLSITRKIGNI